MRVAYVCADPGVPVFGCKGCSVHVREVLAALIRRGSQVDLFATRFGGIAPADVQTVNVHQLPRPPKGDLPVRERAMFAANCALRCALEREGPFDLVYERYSLWSFAGMGYARATGTPGLLEVNAPLIKEQSRHRGLANRRIAEKVAETVFGAARAVIAVSEEVAAYLDRYPAVRGRVHVVSNGVNPERFPVGLPPSRPGPPGVFTIGFVGTFKPWHGLPVLADAFETLHRRHSGYRLLVVGDGPERAALMERLSGSGEGAAAAVECTGAVSPDEVPGCLASMDVAVAPYPQLPTFYFSPLKLYEYMVAGLAVVASRVGEPARFIRHGVNGLLCPPGDAAALAAAIERLRREPQLRRRLGEAARATVLEKHTWDQVVRRICRLAACVSRLPTSQSRPARVDSREAAIGAAASKSAKSPLATGRAP